MKAIAWKDEYVTILIVTSPIVVMFVGCLAAPFGNDSLQILDGGEFMVEASHGATAMDYGHALDVYHDLCGARHSADEVVGDSACDIISANQSDGVSACHS